MRAKFILEKFTEESDPISDMGIGVGPLLKKYLEKIKKLRPWVDIDNKEQIIELFIFGEDGIDKKLSSSFIRYLVRNDPPQQKLKYSLYSCDIELFEQAIEEGARLNTLNDIFKYRWYNKEERKRFIDYLTKLDEKEQLENITNPTYLQKVRDVLALSEERSSPKQYPRGYKIYSLLKYVSENSITDKTDLKKFVYDLSYGKNTFHYIKDSGYWGDNWPTIIGKNKMISKDIDDKNAEYKLTDKGKLKLQLLEKRFKDKIVIPI